MQVVFILMFV